MSVVPLFIAVGVQMIVILLPLVCTQNCVLGFLSACRVYIRLSSVSGVGMQDAAISAVRMWLLVQVGLMILSDKKC